MGTEVLSPRAFFSERFGGSPAVCPRRKSCNYGNSYSYPNQRTNNPNFCIKPRKQNQNHHQKRRSVTGSLEPSISRRSSYDELRVAKNGLSEPSMKRRSVTGSLEPSISRRSSYDELRVAKNGLSEPSMAPIKTRSSSDDLRFARAAEKITILRRGESLDSMIKSDDDVRTMDGNRDVYAGSAFAVSPEPSSLPLPSFSKKKESLVDDFATRDLRRLLRLD